MGNLQVHLDVATEPAVVRGETQAGKISISLSELELTPLTAESRQILAGYCTPDGIPPVHRLAVDAATEEAIATAIADQLERATERRAAKATAAAQRVIDDAEQAALMSCPIDELVQHDPAIDLGRAWQPERAKTDYGTPARTRAEDEAKRRNLAAVAEAVERCPGPDVVEGKLSPALTAIQCIGSGHFGDLPRVIAARKKIREIEESAAELRHAEQAAWVEQHGSERLQQLVAEEIEHAAVYRDERLALERPGWCWGGDVMGDGSPPRNASAEALALLNAARAALPEAIRAGVLLRYWVVEACDEGDCDESYGVDSCPGHHGGWRGYAAETVFLGRAIVWPSEGLLEESAR